MKRALIIVPLVLLPVCLYAGSFTGVVTRVIDGDTICLETYPVDPVDPVSNSLRIRLAGIDAPESDQQYGTEATKALESLLMNKQVRVEWKKRGRYGRVIGTIYHEGHEAHEEESVNTRLVRLGLAWHYKRYSNSPTLAKLHAQAKREGIGLWADNNAIPPWIFRRR